MDDSKLNNSYSTLKLEHFKYATICARPCDRCKGFTRHEQYIGQFALEGQMLFYCLECHLKVIKRAQFD